jgi:hypothetical protein
MYIYIYLDRRPTLFYHSTLCPFGRLLDSTLFPVDIFSHSTLCPIRRLLHSTLFPINVFYHSTLCPIQRFFTFVLMSFRSFVPFDVLSFRRFLPFDILSINILSNSTFCLSTFFTVGVFYFDILSVNSSFLYLL